MTKINSQAVTQLTLILLPILLMIGLIPIIQNDYLLTISYIVLMGIMFSIKNTRKDLLVLILGLIAMFFSEYLFMHGRRRV